MALTKVDDRGLNTPIDLLDDEKIRLGTSNEFELYQDSSTDYGILRNMGQGTIIRSAIFNVKNAGATKDMIVATTNGSVDLYYDNTKKLETRSDGVRLPQDSQRLSVGSTGNLFMHHTGTSGTAHGLLQNDYGVMYHLSDNFEFRQRGTNDTLMKIKGGAEVELYYDNGLKFETRTDGVSVFGNIFLPNDNTSLRIGYHQDLQMWHDNTNGYLSAYNGQLKFLVNGNEKAIVAHPNSGVELYSDNTKRFETGSLGARFFGNLYANDNEKLLLGSSQDLQIYHDGSLGSYIDANNGFLYLRGDSASTIRIQPVPGENSLMCRPNAAVELFYDNSKKVETTSAGATVTGTLTATAFSGDGIIPAGGIIIWSGASNAIPTGWLICDGTNSTPDLRDRFIIGAGNTYSVNATGGSADATLVSHSHTTNTTINPGNTGSKDLQGTVTKIAETYGVHGTATGVFTKTGNVTAGHTPSGVDNSGVGSFSFDGRHRHGTDTQGSSATNANLPPYYALCYIMKS